MQFACKTIVITILYSSDKSVKILTAWTIFKSFFFFINDYEINF